MGMEFSSCHFDEHKKIWFTPSLPGIYNASCSLGKIIFSQLNSFPNEILQIDHTSNIILKSRQVLTLAIRIAQHFNEMGLQQDDIVGFAVKNTTYVLPTVIGCFFNCTPLHAVNPSLDESTLSHCFGLTKPKVIFCDGDNYKKINQATKSFEPKIITLSEHIEGVLKILDLINHFEMEHLYQPKQYSIGASQTVAILCSSGTTGKPKTVCKTGSDLIFENPQLSNETVLYSPSGIDWLTGLLILISSCLTGCTRIITNKPFNADDCLILMKKYRITFVCLPPRYIASLLSHPQANKDVFSSLKSVYTGGSAITEKSLKDLKSLLNENALIVSVYGLTEFGVVTKNTNLERSTSAGQVLPSLHLRIVDDDGNNVGHNKVGEILVYNGKHWNGYYGNPIESQRMRDADGWFHTGDMGYMDENNYLFVVDRKKEIRKFQGIHFWPKEIEDTISEMPGVEDVCVITVSNETEGDCAGALVVRSPNSCIREEDIVEYVKKQLVAIHKQIHAGIYFVDKIPRNPNGKIVRTEAEQIFKSLAKCNSL